MKKITTALIACTIISGLLLLISLKFNNPPILLLAILVFFIPWGLWFRLVFLNIKWETSEDHMEEDSEVIEPPSPSDERLSRRQIGFIFLMIAAIVVSVPIYVIWTIWAFDLPPRSIGWQMYWYFGVHLLALCGIWLPISLIVVILASKKSGRKYSTFPQEGDQERMERARITYGILGRISLVGGIIAITIGVLLLQYATEMSGPHGFMLFLCSSVSGLGIILLFVYKWSRNVRKGLERDL